MFGSRGLVSACIVAALVVISLFSGTARFAVAGGDVEQRIADFWKRVDALQPGDYLSAADLGQWALNVIERNPRARTTVADFRGSTGGMQAGLDRAGLAPTSPTAVQTPAAIVEQRIADFWKRIDALQPGEYLSAADLGRWALNVIERNPRARTSVADFRTSTGEMQTGMDRAGLAPVTVTPTPTTGPSSPPTATATPKLAPTLAPAATSRTIGGLTFRIKTTLSTDLYMETAISDTDTLAGLIEPAVAYLQAEFRRPFSGRPQIYAFGSDASILAGWNSVLGGTGPAPIAKAGIQFGGTGPTALNWPRMKVAQPFSTVRHELAHKMQHQITNERPIPLWFDEGLARLEDLSVPGGAYRIVDSRYSVGSQASTATLLNVMAMTDETFRALPAEQGSQAYLEAAETVRLMQSDLTQSGIIRILDALGTGQSFDAAYAAVSGGSLATFIAGRNARLLELAPAPGIATAADTVSGPGMSIMVYGLAPLSTFTLAIAGSASSSSPIVHTADQFGVYRTYLEASWPVGSYTLTVTTSLSTFSTAGVKTASIDPAIGILQAGAPFTLSIPETPWDLWPE